LISAGALPQTLLRSLWHSPKPLAGFQGPTSKRKEKRGDIGESREGEEGKGVGDLLLRDGNWKGREKENEA